MAKQQDFAEKVKKAGLEKGIKCKVCSGQKISTLFINSIKSRAGSYRFNRVQIQVCKCNEKSVYV